MGSVRGIFEGDTQGALAAAPTTDGGHLASHYNERPEDLIAGQA